jgi:osmotically-inducible protein OsmY
MVEAKKIIDDPSIRSAIIADLTADDAVPSHRIDVNVRDGVVSLGGSVYNLLARDRAIDISQSIKGVRSVVSLIDILPVARPDDEIAKDVKNAIVLDPVTDSYEVKIKVKKGTVILSGKVDSYQEKQLCTEVVKGVRGVKSIENNIDIDFKKDRPEYEIKAEIERLLEHNVRVNPQNIKVSVSDDKVTLSGSVGSALEMTRAATLAWVTGVRLVQNDLVVLWDKEDKSLKRDEFVFRTDEEIEKSVLDAFIYDPRVYSFKVQVTSDNGTVTLSGTVDNLKAKKAAEKDARNTAGVWSVINEIDVRPDLVIDDMEIVKRVKEALRRSPYLDRHDFLISSYNGKVFLYGTTDTEFEKYKAGDVAWNVQGVVDVQNNISVRSEWIQKTDLEIERDIESQLFWSPFVDENEIEVSVDFGIATITGSVNTWSEYIAAVENAYEGGARSVKNNLRVREAERN